MAPTAPALESVLKRLPNGRDLHDSWPSIRAGAVLRCANPTGLDESTARDLLQVTGIRVLVDLRSPEELAEDASLPPLFSGAEIVTHYRSGMLVAQMATTTRINAGDALPNGSRVTLHNAALLDKQRYYFALLARLPMQTTLSALTTAVWDGTASRSMLIMEVNKGGLPLLYEIILETAKLEICNVLKVVLSALQARTPIMFFCKAGKDRTGLLAALLLSIAGATDEAIIADYTRSAGQGRLALGGMEKRKELQGLDKSVFEDAPADAIKGALQHLRHKYGSVHGYLTAIGFAPDMQLALRDALLSI